MSSRHLVDPELLGLVDQFAGFEVSAESLPALRQMTRDMLPMQAAAATDAVVREERHVPGPPGAPPVRLLLYRPTATAASARGALLYLHGGGMVSGFADACDARCTRWAERLGCVVVSVDYRLAPETPHPGPVEDAYAALRWLHGEAAALGVDAGRIAVGGESAGGGLAAALALLARDRGELPLAFQLLVYPMLDDRTGSSVAASPLAGEFVWTEASNRFGWRSLLGHAPGGAGVPAHAAPARAKDLAGLPPAFIAVGALDLFIDENLDYARRLIGAGVATELHVYPGAVHAFDLIADAAVTRTFEAQCLTALGRALAVR